jgi:hypothetical protein
MPAVLRLAIIHQFRRHMHNPNGGSCRRLGCAVPQGPPGLRQLGAHRETRPKGPVPESCPFSSLNQYSFRKLKVGRFRLQYGAGAEIFATHVAADIYQVSHS